MRNVLSYLQCSVGRVYADLYCGFECFGPQFAHGRGVLSAGRTYELCVAAVSWGAVGSQYVKKCAPIDPLTNVAAIAG